jgi:hypothetical protein
VATEQDVKEGVYVGYTLPPSAVPKVPDRIYWGKVIEICPSVYGRTLPCVKVEAFNPEFPDFKDTELVMLAQVVYVKDHLPKQAEGVEVPRTEENVQVGRFVGYKLLRIGWARDPDRIWTGQVLELVRASPTSRPYAYRVESLELGHEGEEETIYFRQIVWIKRPIT